MLIVLLAIIGISAFYLMIVFDASGSPGVGLCRYLRKLASASLRTQNHTTIESEVDPTGNRDATMSILEHDITVITPDGMRVDLHRRPLSIEVEGQSIPTSFLDTVAIAWTFRSLVRSRRRAERAVFSEIVNAL